MSAPATRRLLPVLALAIGLGAPSATAATLVVAQDGSGDFTAIAPALAVAAPGDLVLVRGGIYAEAVRFPRSGTPGSPIRLEAWPGERPVIDGSSLGNTDLVRIENRSHLRFGGFELRNLAGARDASAIRILGAGTNIEIRDHIIHDLRGTSAMAITVYGTEPTPISELVIADNEIHDCEPAPSEALVLNGNVTDFEISGNRIRDVNNIGIDLIGGETDIQPDPGLVVRNGVVRGNTVERARSVYGGGFAAGIYVDGARDVVIEGNRVTGSDLGIEVGAENAGITARGVVVRSNLLHGNEKAGLVFGGFAASAGRVEACEFRNNTLVGNDTLGSGFGELWVQFATGNTVRNNLIAGGPAGLLLVSYEGNSANDFRHNLWWAPPGSAASTFVWNGVEHVGFEAWRAATGQGAFSLFADPHLVDAGTGPVPAWDSPALDLGDPATSLDPGETDRAGEPRLFGAAVDAGADEWSCGNGATETGELCDDGNAVSGDGCDANCAPTGCGNGIRTAGEACDDGNTSPGDCCAPDCELEPAGSPCDDGDACTAPDRCDALGTCGAAPAPEPVCRAAGRATLLLRGPPGGSPDGRLRLAWKRGDALGEAELGDPELGPAGATVCLFDRAGGVPELLFRAELAPGGLCRGRPCWRALPAGGDRYLDRDGRRAGVRRLVLRPGGDGESRAVLLARGTALSLPPTPLAGDPAVEVQIHTAGGACLGATFSAPTRNEAGLFKARGP